MKKLLIILLLSSNISYSQGCLQADIMLVVDMSGSMINNAFFVKQALDSFVDRFELSESGIKLGIVYFNNSNNLTKLTSNEEEIRNAISSENMLSLLGGLTYMEQALNIASIELIESERNAPKIMIIISDACVDDRNETLLMSGDIKLFGIHTIGILIENGSSQEGFMRMITDVMYISEYESLERELEALDYCP